MSDFIGFTKDQLATIKGFVETKNRDAEYFAYNYELIEDEKVRKGSYGVVIKVRCLTTQEEFALKTVTIRGRGTRERGQEQGVESQIRNFYQACQEAIIHELYQLSHSNLIDGDAGRNWIELPSTVINEFSIELACFLSGDQDLYTLRGDEVKSVDELMEALIGTKIYIVSQWFEHDMDSFLPPRVQEEYQFETLQQQTRSVVEQVSCGLEYLHGKDIIHGDIKPNNVYVNVEELRGEVSAVLGDLGNSKRDADFIYETDGNENDLYGAPERLLTKKRDVWSFGTFLFYSFIFCATGRKASPPMLKEFKAIATEKRYTDLRQYLKNNLPDEQGILRELIVQCMQWDPGDRPDSPIVRRVLGRTSSLEKALNHVNSFVQNSRPEQMIFPSFFQMLIENSNDKAIPHQLHPDVYELIEAALRRGDSFPVLELFNNCDVKMLHGFAKFIHDTCSQSA